MIQLELLRDGKILVIDGFKVKATGKDLAIGDLFVCLFNLKSRIFRVQCFRNLVDGQVKDLFDPTPGCWVMPDDENVYPYNYTDCIAVEYVD